MKRIKKITRHTLKFFIIPLAILIVICVGTASAVFYFYPKDKVLKIVTAKAEEMLKRKVTAGEINYSLAGVRLSNVVILNSMDSADSALIKIGRLGLRFDLLSIITKKFEIKHLQIDDMDLVLSHNGTVWNLESLLNDLKSGPVRRRKEGKTKKDEKDTSTILTIGFDNAAVTLESAPSAIEFLKGKYLFNGVVDVSDPDAIFVRSFTVVLPENRGELESSEIKVFPLDRNFAVTGDVQLNNATMGWLYKRGGIDLPYMEVTAKINGLSVTSSDLRGTLTGTTRLKNRAAVNLTTGFKARFSPFLLTMNDSHVKTGSSEAHLRQLTAGKGIYPSFSSDSINGRLEEIGPVIPYFPVGIFGHAEGNLDCDNLVFTGRLALRDLGFDRDRKLVSGISGTLNVSRNSFKVENLPAKILSNDAVISVAAPSDLLKDIAVNAKINMLDFGSGEKNGTNGESAAAQETGNGADSKAKNSQQPGLPTLPLKVRGALEIGRVKKNGYELKDVEASFDYSGTKILIPRCRFSILDAMVMGSGTVYQSGSSLQVDTKASIDGLKVQNLGTISKEIEGRLYGNAKARVSLSFRPGEGNIADTLQGSCDFLITNGKVANTGVQNALGIWLDSLKYKLKDLEFNTISGSVSADRGNLDIKTLIFNSPDIRVMVNGDVRKKTDLNAKLVLEFNSSFLQDVPNPAVAMIQISGYKKGKWYTIPRSVKGNISEGKYETSEIK